MKSPKLLPDTQPCPYVFVVGCPRSGTTLLQRMLDAHPQLAIANDSHFIPRALDRIGIDENRELLPSHVEFVKNYHRMHRLGLSAEDIDAAAIATTYPKFVANIYQRFAKKNGKPLAGEKTPDYVKRIDLLHALFPQAKFIHIIRDGREVIQSVVDWSNGKKGPAKFNIWKENPLGVAALWWAHQVRSGTTSGRLIPERYMEVRYDELVSRPVQTLRSIAKFLHIENSSTMSQFHIGKTKPGARLSAKRAWLPATAGLRDTNDLESAQLQLFEMLCSDLLKELNMPIYTDLKDTNIAWQATQLRRRWDLEMAARSMKRRAVARHTTIC